MTHTDHRSVVPDARATPAEEIADLLTQLYQGVTTREQVPQFRRVTRVRKDRTTTSTFVEFRPHVTRAPGLLRQLGVIAAPGTVTGTVIPGGSVPGGSPGWDEDGALSPMVAGTSEPTEPIADAWHVAREVDADVTALVEQLHAEGREGSLVDMALESERAGTRIAARLRGLVQRARVAASYDAPMMILRDVCCPSCGGDLKVRTDASSAVWCTGTWPVEGPALRGDPWPLRAMCGARWPRGAWVQLLADVTPS